jgi:hypothetical protein
MHIPVNYAQVNFSLTGTLLPHGAEVTFGVAPTPDIDGPEAIEVIKSAWEDAGLAGGFSQQLVISSVKMKWGPNETGRVYESPWNWAGADGSQPLPPNVALLVTKQTDWGGKKSKGRFYWPGLTEAVSNGGGQVNPAAFDTYVDGFNSFRDALDGGNVPMVLLHAEDQSDVIPYFVKQLSAQSTMATQRRRLR